MSSDLVVALTEFQASLATAAYSISQAVAANQASVEMVSFIHRRPACASSFNHGRETGYDNKIIVQ
jgi:hypothetical protein